MILLISKVSHFRASILLAKSLSFSNLMSKFETNYALYHTHHVVNFTHRYFQAFLGYSSYEFTASSSLCSELYFSFQEYQLD